MKGGTERFLAISWQNDQETWKECPVQGLVTRSYQ